MHTHTQCFPPQLPYFPVPYGFCHHFLLLLLLCVCVSIEKNKVKKKRSFQQFNQASLSSPGDGMKPVLYSQIFQMEMKFWNKLSGVPHSLSFDLADECALTHNGAAITRCVWGTENDVTFLLLDGLVISLRVTTKAAQWQLVRTHKVILRNVFYWKNSIAESFFKIERTIQIKTPPL